jgi:hypothetical protein
MDLISLLKSTSITVLFYAALSYVTFHFFSTLFVFTLIFCIGCICFVSYTEQKEKEHKEGSTSGDLSMGGAETLSQEILGVAILFFFWGIVSGMLKVKKELQKRINKFYVFLILLLVALTGLGLGWLLESSASKFLR